jgi:selenide,water dikinase
MTDVTGFGLLGHLVEMAEGSELSAEIYYDKIPAIDGIREYISQRISPDATSRNWNSYHEKIRFEKGMNVMEAFILLPDPQTNGGILFSVNENSKDEIVRLLRENGLANYTGPIGRFIKKGEKVIEVRGQQNCVPG